ncbi:hypothetical protein ACJU26_09230 [Acidithiobacillus sp. M4-SHS-6]|uniref:hypothetical protein n=1 Tax=Acidithiobacillus sp. M4-SHS-6 TaxID=3383024 RepID=UPI0039BE173F
MNVTVIPGVSIAGALKESLQLMPRLILYLIGPWLVFTLANIWWWRLPGNLRFTVLDVLAIGVTPFLWTLIHLLDVRSSESCLAFLRRIPGKSWMLFLLILAFMGLGALWISAPIPGGISLITLLALTQVGLLLGIPTGFIAWKYLFAEGTQRFQELLSMSTWRMAYTAPGVHLFWRMELGVLPLYVLTLVIPTGFLPSFLSGCVMVFANVFVYVLTRQYFRNPANSDIPVNEL